MDTDKDSVPIELREFADFDFCPRRYVLKFKVGRPQALTFEMADGLAQHQGVSRRRGEQFLFSERLNLVGRLDTLFRRNGQLVLQEHKRRADNRAAIQVQAQWLCAAEMGIEVAEAQLYDRQSRTVSVVRRDDAAVERMASAMRGAIKAPGLPPVLPISRRPACRFCSVRELCQPEAADGPTQAAPEVASRARAKGRR